MSGHADTIRSHLMWKIALSSHDATMHRELAEQGIAWPSAEEALGALDALLAENQRLRDAASYARATLRGMLSDPNVTRSIDLRPEIEMLDRALAGDTE